MVVAKREYLDLQTKIYVWKPIVYFKKNIKIKT